MTETAERGRDAVGGEVPGTRLASLGLAMAAAGPLLFAVVGLLYGFETGDLGFFLVTGVVGVIGAVVVRRPALWAHIVGVLVAVLLGFMLWWTIFGLFSPNSVVDFTGGLLVVPGVILALVGSVMSIRGRRAAGGPGTGERRAVQVVPAVVVALALVSLVLTLTARESVDAPADAVVVTMSDFEFDPEDVNVDGGGRLLLRNDDPFLHTFNVDELGIEETFTPGSEKLVSIPAEPGTYVLYCEPHTSDPDDPGDDDMAGTLSVE